MNDADCYLFFDTETTGLPVKGNYDNPYHPQTPRLVELAALLYDSRGNEIEQLHRVIKPEGFTIPKQASDVHGITHEIAMEKGTPLREAIESFDVMLRRSIALIAHNIQFDKLIYRRERIALGFPDTRPRNLEFICTKELTTPICKIPSPWGSYKWPTLMEAYITLFKERFQGAHSAFEDVRACARIYFHINPFDKPES